MSNNGSSDDEIYGKGYKISQSANNNQLSLGSLLISEKDSSQQLNDSSPRYYQPELTRDPSSEEDWDTECQGNQSWSAKTCKKEKGSTKDKYKNLDY